MPKRLTPSLAPLLALCLASALLFIAAALLRPTLAATQPGTLLTAQPETLAQGAQPLDQVERLVMPAVDAKALMAEDQQRLRDGLPSRFAQPIPVRITPATHGTWEALPDGTQLWRLRLAAPGALSLNLGFTRYTMPADGALYLYTLDYGTVRGPFTAADNEAHGQLWSPLLLADEIVVEVRLPASQVGQLGLELTSVNHGYRAFGEPHVPDSGSCNLDVVCSAADGYPQVEPWRDPIRSVAVISTGGSTFCTGFLVNNVEEDLSPFFMTANHCGINSGNAPSLVAYWNFENSYCREPGSAASGGPGDGSLDQYTTGALFRAGYSPSDFTLVEFDDPIPSEFNVHWAGWDATSGDFPGAVAIHHPDTDEKRISFEDDPVVTTSYLGNNIPGDGTHIRVFDWDLGTTEPGSSGSPLFNPAYRVVGQLHGGYAACGNDDPDWYGRFSVSWVGGGNSANSLRPWLDPDNTGSLLLDGRDEVMAPDFTLEATPDSIALCTPAQSSFAITIGSQNGYTDPVSLSVEGLPSDTEATFEPDTVIAPGSSVLTLDIMAAVEGHYDLEISGIAPTSTHTTTVGLDLFAENPDVVTLLAPADEATDQPTTPTFQWEPAAAGTTYTFELATDPSFNNVVDSASGLTDASYTPTEALEPATAYYWRVQAENVCGAGELSETFAFITGQIACAAYASTDVPKPIGPNGGTNSYSELTLSLAGAVNDVDVINLAGTHSWVGDLSFFLESPSGTEIQLRDQTCGSDANFNIGYDDEAASGEPPCPPTDGNSYQPLEPLATFDGEEAGGTWTLRILDNANGDSGQLQSWGLNLCYIAGTGGDGTLSGTITAENRGGPIAGATITVVQGGTSYTATSDANGEYSLDVPEGFYDITVSADGYGTRGAFDVPVIAGQTTVRDFALGAPTALTVGTLSASETRGGLNGLALMMGTLLLGVGGAWWYRRQP